MPALILRAAHVALEEGIDAAREPEWAFGVGGNIIGALVDKNIAAELNGMLALEPRNAVGDLIHAVRADGFGPGVPELELKAALKEHEGRP